MKLTAKQAPPVTAKRVRAVKWLVPDRTIRVALIEDEAWFVVMDLCWALGLDISSNRKPNVTVALARINIEDRRFVMIETDPGSFKPYTRYAATSRTGVLALVERAHVNLTGGVQVKDKLNAWIECASSEVGANNSEESLDIAV
jgi:hypothetical protein